MFNQMYDRNESDRDTVVMEQRGGGDSQANFDCPEVTDVYYTVLNQDSSSKEVLQKYLQAYRACHDRLVNSGVNLSAYTTAAIAADINDLRQALGYDQWNLYEFTYGSHLALTVMRDYPQGIRSVILDSVVPPQVDTLAEQGASAEATLNLFFQRCAEDEQCNAAFPSLKNIFYDLVSQLNAHPILMQASDLQEGKRYDILVTGDRLLEVVLASLVASYQDSLPEIPRMIFQAHDGNFLVLTDIMGRFVDELAPSSSGMQWISFCSEDAPFTSREKVANANARLDPSLTNYFTTQAETALDVCSIWNVMKAPGVTNDPITSNIPTLVLAGEFNWPAPPSWAKLAVQTLSDSSYFEFANTGQGVLYSRTWSDCSTKIVGAFLANPSAQPDGSCTQEEKKMLWITLK
jgi:pimeloyl-ACP methyl ester carboxylesterase